MKKTISALTFLAVATLPVIAQEARNGISKPDDTEIMVSEESPKLSAKPSAAIAKSTSDAAPSTTYGAYVPYRGPKVAATPSVSIPLTEAEADSSVVTSVVDLPGELREGTLLKARLQGKLSTLSTNSGSTFTALLIEPVTKDGTIILPTGSSVQGRVTAVHSGRRISGTAMIHLEAETILLPNGTEYRAHLQLIDTDQTSRTKVDGEGSIIRRDHPRQTLAAVGLATGGAAAAGAVMAGGIGAAVGAGIGAGAGTILWLKQDRQETIPEQALLVFSLSSPLPIHPPSATASLRATERPSVLEAQESAVARDQ